MINRDSADLKEILQIKEMPVQVFFSEFYDIVHKGFFAEYLQMTVSGLCCKSSRPQSYLSFFSQFLVHINCLIFLSSFCFPISKIDFYT